nr:MAG TPA: tail completion protein [Caudoviricetes sp.]DAW58183.1 MAG TPA: tail completion protein [Caudoviricetes sp.]
MRTYKDLLHLLQQAAQHNRVYFQPPENLKIGYPAIVFHLSKIEIDRASDVPYKGAKEYSVTLITKDPEPDVINEILKIPYSSLDTTYISDGMNHFVFTVYL